MLSSYAVYHAKDWAEGKTKEEIKEEIARCKKPHTYQWNQVGNEHQNYSRIVTLENILKCGTT